MEIILLTDIERLGKRGNVVKVKDGYARNYLIPKGKALRATDSNLRRWEAEKRFFEAKRDKEEKGAESIKEKIDGLSLKTTLRIGEDGKTFGAITSSQISELLKEKGIEIDKKSIELDSPIKEPGVYTIEIKLYPGVSASFKLWVVEEK